MTQITLRTEGASYDMSVAQFEIKPPLIRISCVKIEHSSYGALPNQWPIGHSLLLYQGELNPAFLSKDSDGGPAKPSAAGHSTELINSSCIERNVMLVSDLVNQFKEQSILVTGDTYIDYEIYGEVLRLAPEAPVPVVKVKSKRFIPGGGANIAKSISLLGGNAFLYGYFGADEASQEILDRLHLDKIRVPSSPPSPTLRLP